jgi:hypothetical protein
VNANFVSITDNVRLDKLQKAIDLLERTLNSELLFHRVKNHSLNGRKMFVESNNVSNKAVFLKLNNGDETLTRGIDHEADLTLTFYRAMTSTVGYTTPSITLIKINLKFFDQYSLAEVAGNLAHEWSHKLGFTHPSQNTPTRVHTVPYAFGYMVRDIAEDLE